MKSSGVCKLRCRCGGLHRSKGSLYQEGAVAAGDLPRIIPRGMPGARSLRARRLPRRGSGCRGGRPCPPFSIDFSLHPVGADAIIAPKAPSCKGSWRAAPEGLLSSDCSPQQNSPRPRRSGSLPRRGRLWTVHGPATIKSGGIVDFIKGAAGRYRRGQCRRELQGLHPGRHLVVLHHSDERGGLSGVAGRGE